MRSTKGFVEEDWRRVKFTCFTIWQQPFSGAAEDFVDLARCGIVGRLNELVPCPLHHRRFDGRRWLDRA
jgi:hypothetical protein